MNHNQANHTHALIARRNGGQRRETLILKGNIMSAFISNSKTTKDEASSARENDALSEEALDQVAGGLNPQPLPPIVRDRP